MKVSEKIMKYPTNYSVIHLEYDGGIQTPFYELLKSTGEYDNDLLDSSMSVFIPNDYECPYIVYHLISGSYRVIGAKLDYCTDNFDEVEHYLLTK